MKIIRSGERPTEVAPPTWFTGDVSWDPVHAFPPEAKLEAVIVHFAPGARTAWHTHELGQSIWVTEGEGLCQRDGQPIQVIRPGDCVYFEPGERHWHGAAPNRLMVHMAIKPTDAEGVSFELDDLVTDEEYHGPRA
ncbi:cupin domain-containing protein [Microbacterium sp. X-17]|uniref:(R)-mandelonitrile lyase n=1 Tax=Microbacterium sp. X-17 TaxID=3144404 RepID=UPI0031F55678